MTTFIDDSDEYWEHRYANGGNSGSGSYGRLAEFKAEIINNFIKNNGISSIVDYGVGDGYNLEYYDLAQVHTYIGLDVSKTAIDGLKSKGLPDKYKFFCINSDDDVEHQGDLVLSQDVLYHLIDDAIYYKYLTNLFKMSKKYVIIYACDEDLEELSVHHMLVRRFTPYIREEFRSFKLINTIPNKYPYIPLSRDSSTSVSSFHIYERVE